MWDFLTRSRATLQRELAVAQVRLVLAEEDNRELRTRLADVSGEYARFRDQVWARLGAISAPVTPEASASARTPRVSPFAALSITEMPEKRTPFPEPVMPDA